ncbi:hypothetical protein Ga0074812_12692 [Parafrankia irregularis]|uniref:Short-chain dehydrogenase n=1 Tax=Parafrankia irregularis TaxID=795642 RepID=A0A0S4QUZ4_9ACTN|nr:MULTISPECIES: SDR family NAD(P)-dependent oxidoreductase [Parafrankia]MBE3199941.1 SDR family NAD(P)-dependent oxidoreductase [Parafrankia sp. CH37]CUU59315.1 hypothetical protein Ga0074812_12692 [Parafrankia irregularis]
MARGERLEPRRYGRYAIVAGASRGIGAELADQLAARGFDLVLIAPTKEELEPRADSVRARYGVEAVVLPVDLSTPEAAERIESATADLEVGLLVYNAAIAFSGPFWGKDLDYYRSLNAVNMLTPFELIHRLAPRLVRQRRGGIILISSAAGMTAQPYLSAYSASKAWVTNFGLGMWAELKPYDVDVFTAIVGATDTPGLREMMQPDFLSGTKLARPADVAAEVLASFGRQPVRVIGAGNRRTMGFFRLAGMNNSARLMTRIMAKVVYRGAVPQQPVEQ